MDRPATYLWALGRRHTSDFRMPFSATDDAVEALWYVAGFWRFVFSSSYRQEALGSFVRANPFRRTVMCLEAGVATACGAGVPALILWIALT